MPDNTCPACGSAAVSTTATVRTSDLIHSYRSMGIDAATYLATTPEIAMHQCRACDLGFFSPPCAGDGAFYEQLQRFDWYYQDEKPEYAFAGGHVAAGSRVLEVGCGKGAFRAWLAPDVAYTGLEFNDEAVRKAQAAGLDVRKQPVQEHAAAGARYDVVCSFQVLEHVTDPKGFVHACVQALVPGGKLIIAVPAQDSFLAVAPNAPLNMPPHHVSRWSDQALARLAQREGLATVELWHEPVAPFHREWQAQTLAHHYFALRGLARTALIERGLRYRLIGRLLRYKPLRDRLAASVARRKPQLAAGHTVVLVASA